jgi:hypothetical protein
MRAVACSRKGICAFYRTKVYRKPAKSSRKTSPALRQLIQRFVSSLMHRSLKRTFSLTAEVFARMLSGLCEPGLARSGDGATAPHHQGKQRRPADSMRAALQVRMSRMSIRSTPMGSLPTEARAAAVQDCCRA